MGQADLVMVEEFLHQRRKSVTDGEEVGVKGALPNAMSIHLVLSRGHDLYLVRNAILGLELRQTLGH